MIQMFHNLNSNLWILVTSCISVHHHDQTFKESAILAEMIIPEHRMRKLWKDLEECLISMQSIRERRFTERPPLFRMRPAMKTFLTLNWNLFIKIALILRLIIFNQLQEEELTHSIETINSLPELQISIRILRFKCWKIYLSH